MSVLVLVSSSRFSFRFAGFKVHFRSIDWHRSIDRNFARVEREPGRGAAVIPVVAWNARENSRLESGLVNREAYFSENTEYAAVNEGLIVYSWALLLT